MRWKDVIVPKFYEAYRCGGECKFPLDKKVSSLHLLSMGSWYGYTFIIERFINDRGIGFISHQQTDSFFMNSILLSCNPGCVADFTITQRIQERIIKQLQYGVILTTD